MAMKCVAQIAKPVEVADTASQTHHMRAPDLRTWCNRLIAVYEPKAQMTAARTTSRRSCSVAIQSNTLYMHAHRVGEPPPAEQIGGFRCGTLLKYAQELVNRRGQVRRRG